MRTLKTLSFLAVAALMATPAIAADDMNLKVGGKVATYFGQYSDGSTSALTNVSEANIHVKASQGPLSVYFELENRNGTPDNIVTQRSAKYERDGFTMQIGTVYPKSTVSFSNSGGSGTSQLASDVAGYSGFTSKIEADGIGFGYTLSDAVTLEAALFDAAYHNGETGSTSMFGARGTVSDLQYRVSSVSETADSGNSAGTSNLSVKYAMDDLDASLNMMTKTVDTGTTADTTDNSLQIGYKVNKTQKAIVTLGSIDASGTATTVTMLVYDFKLAKLGSMQLLYASNATDALTKTFTGLGFKAGF